MSKDNSLREMLDKGEVWYLSLSTHSKGEDFGYIKTNIELNKHLAFFAVKNQVNKVEAVLSRNIMADAEKTQIFKVNVDISI